MPPRPQPMPPLAPNMPGMERPPPLNGNFCAASSTDSPDWAIMPIAGATCGCTIMEPSLLYGMALSPNASQGPTQTLEAKHTTQTTYHRRSIVIAALLKLSNLMSFPFSMYVLLQCI